MKKAQAEIRRQGKATMPSLQTNIKHPCGCKFDLYHDRTDCALAVNKDDLCEMDGHDHAFVYSPSIAMVHSGEAVQMFATFIKS